MKIADRISVSRINNAVHKIDKKFLDSPQFRCESLSNALKCKIILKDETTNPIRSFKARGTELLTSNIINEHELVCASAGNFGQALAYSCNKRNIRTTIFASINANSEKVEKMRSLGANIVLQGNDFDEAKCEAKSYAKKLDLRFIEDSLDIETVEGAGTIGLELLNLSVKLDYLLIALGNGALLTGVAKIFKEFSPYTKIVAVQAKGASAMIESWRKNKVIDYLGADTIADGIAIRLPIPQVLTDMKGLIDEGILIEDKRIIEGIRLIYKHTGLIVEPSAAVGIAAVLEYPDIFKNKRVCTILSGANLSAKQISEWI